jgi:hypothetical protein
VCLRVCPASNDDTVGLGARKFLDQDLRGFADLAKKQRGHPGQLAAQPCHKLPEAKRHWRGTDVATDDDERGLSRLHQSVSARAK